MDEVHLCEWIQLLMSGFLGNVLYINGLDLVLFNLWFAGQLVSTMVGSVIAI